MGQHSAAFDERVRQSLSPLVPTLIRGLFVELPPEGSVWPLERREAWVTAARAVFEVLYETAPAEASAAGRAPAFPQQDSAASAKVAPRGAT